MFKAFESRLAARLHDLTLRRPGRAGTAWGANLGNPVGAPPYGRFNPGADTPVLPPLELPGSLGP